MTSWKLRSSGERITLSSVTVLISYHMTAVTCHQQLSSPGQLNSTLSRAPGTQSVDNRAFILLLLFSSSCLLFVFPICVKMTRCLSVSRIGASVTFWCVWILGCEYRSQRLEDLKTEWHIAKIFDHSASIGNILSFYMHFLPSIEGLCSKLYAALEVVRRASSYRYRTAWLQSISTMTAASYTCLPPSALTWQNY